MKRVLIAAALIAAVCTPAAALDFTQPLHQLNGEPFTSPDGKPTSVTLGTLAETALLTLGADEAALPGEDRVKRFVLAQRVHESKDAVLTADEIALIKKLIAKTYGPLFVGQAWRMLDPASVPK